jgi:predicted ATPase
MRGRGAGQDLSIHVLGSLCVRWQGKRVRGIETRRADELLAYLAIFHRSRVPEAFETRTIATVVHFDVPQNPDCAFNGLAKALTQIRTLLDHPPNSVLGDRRRRSRNRNESVVPHLNLYHVFVDKLRFEELLSALTPESLLDATLLYRGHLLHGAKWNWLKGPRENCASGLLRALKHPVARRVAKLDSRSWGRALRRLITLPPIDEFSVRKGNGSEGLRSAAYSLYADLLAELTEARRFKAANLEYERLVRVSRPSELPVPDDLSRLNANSCLEQEQFERRGLGSILPAFLTDFISRPADEARILDLVRKNRLTTITGAGGIGKTRLAVSVAREIEEEFYNRVAFIGLATISGANGIVRRIASVLRIPATNDDPELLIDRLSEKKMLLVLDNCEHVLEAAASVADALLTGCPELRLLATSRSKLGIPGEVGFELGGLAYPTNGEASDALHRYSAVRLFISRMKSGSGYHLATQDMKHVGGVCRLMEGMPLAICIAAARAANAGLAQVVKELDRGFELPGLAGQLPKDQTIQSSLDWGYRLLDPSLQKFLVRLSCFRGGWDKAALLKVCGEPDHDQAHVLGLQETLRSMSWIDFDGSRFKMLEPIRAYVARKNLQSGGFDETASRHFLHFAELARMADLELMSSKMPRLMRVLLAEEDNFESALEWSLKRLPERGAELCRLLAMPWVASGNVHNGCQWTERFLSQDLSEPIRIQLLVELSVLQYYRSDYDAAVRAGEAAFAADLVVLDRDTLSILHLNMGSCLFFGREAMKKSLSYLTRAVAIAQDGASVWVKAICLSNLAYFGVRAPDNCGPNDLDGLELSRRALEFAKATENQWVLAHVLVNHGIVLRFNDRERSGFYNEERIEAFKNALRIYVAIGETFGALQALEGLSEVAIEKKQYAEAARLFGAQRALETRGRVRLALHHKTAHENNVADAQSALGTDLFDMSFAQGFRNNIEEFSS